MANVYNRGKLVLTDGTHRSGGWADGAANIGVVLVTSTYAYDADHNFVSDVTNELSGGGYARQTGVGGRAITENDASNRVEYDMNDVTFATLALAAGQPFAAIVYNAAPASDAARQVLAYCQLTAPPVPNGGDYTVVWDAARVVYLSD